MAPVLCLQFLSRLLARTCAHLAPGFPRPQRAPSLGHVQSSVSPWTVARQAPLSMACPRQEYWSLVAISFSRGSSREPASPASAGGFFTTQPSGNPCPCRCPGALPPQFMALTPSSLTCARTWILQFPHPPQYHQLSVLGNSESIRLWNPSS